MNINYKNVEEKVIIQVDNSMLKHDVSEDFKNSILDVANKYNKYIILDFSYVKYISINACEALVEIYRALSKKQLGIIIIRTEKSLKRIFDDIKFTDVFVFFDSLSDAISFRMANNTINDRKQNNNNESTHEEDTLKSINDKCSNWKGINFFSIFLKKRCKTCRFFKEKNKSTKGVCKK